MTETAQDAYVKGYNQGRADEAAASRPTGIITLPAGTSQKDFDEFKARYAAAFGGGPQIIKEEPMFKTPDVTPVQAVALVGAVLAVAASFGFDLSQQQQDSIMQLVSIVAGLLLAGDAVIRHGRATGNAKKDV